MVAEDSLETALMGNCGATINITGLPITCIDLTYDSAGKPIVFIGTRDVQVFSILTSLLTHTSAGSVYWIADETFPAAWADLKLSCYGCCANTISPLGCFDVFSMGAAPDFATSNKTYALISKPTTLIFCTNSDAVVTLTAASGR